jgi:hypothetical protein
MRSKKLAAMDMTQIPLEEGLNLLSKGFQGVELVLHGQVQNPELKPKVETICCVGWSCKTNERFGQLTLELASGRNDIFRKLADNYSRIGHQLDLKVQCDKLVFTLSRPVCVDYGPGFMLFDFLIDGLE